MVGCGLQNLLLAAPSTRSEGRKTPLSPTSIGSLFQSNGRFHVGLVAVFIFINALVFINAVLTDPRTGFDASDHIAYIRTLAFHQRLPNRSDTVQFFSPPLPYVLPALFLGIMAQFPAVTTWLIRERDAGDIELWPGKPASEYGLKYDMSFSEVVLTGLAAKLAHMLNWAFSVGLILYLLKTCELMRPGNAQFKALTLFFLGSLPIYYKSFTFIRGEPMMAFLVVVAVYSFLFMTLQEDYSRKRIVYLGVVLGLAVLARQWAFFVFPAFFLFVLFSWSWRSGRENRLLLKALVGSTIIAALIGGWFYLSVKSRFGEFTKYTVKRVSWDRLLSSQPPEFYLSLDTDKLFTTPVRPAFPNHLIPIFYSEMWGDYWGYFITTRSGQTEATKAYLGRVNLLSLLPTFVFLSALGWGFNGFFRMLFRREQGSDKTALGVMVLVIVSSAVGYLWFLLSFPEPSGRGSTIKAMYLLHVFPFVAILAAGLFERMKQRIHSLYWVVLALLTAVALHNLPAMITHYILRFGAPRLAW